MSKQGYLKSENAEYIDELYQKYLNDPNSVDESWQYLFEGIELAGGASTAEPSANSFESVSAPLSNVSALPQNVLSSEVKVGELIQRYRELGNMLANINPLQEVPQNYKTHPLFELSHFNLSASDLEKKFTAAKLIGFTEAKTLGEILEHLNQTYCRSIGVEFTHIQDKASRQWLQEKMEATRNQAQYPKALQERILKKLTEAECFERFLHTRYVGQKRFSVEGGDAVIAMLDGMINEAGILGATDLVLGMAHRGRLSVLTTIFGKKFESIFSEFEGTASLTGTFGEGDVKYHMGYSADYPSFAGKTLHLSLASNPSHLEFVNPVVEGVTFAKQKLKERAGISFAQAKQEVVPVLIHGDAAFAGQGCVYETLQLSLLKGYGTGGTIHIVINNQVGFTTLPTDSRSTTYSTDLAKMLESPIFHVNGDDAEAVYFVTQLATQYRQTYHKDVVIDLVCYRKYGHNEGDEPEFTQPLMYRKIKKHPSPREIYAQKLIEKNVMSAQEVQGLVDQMNEKLTAAHQLAKTNKDPVHISVFEGAWKGLRRAQSEDFFAPVKTQVSASVLKEISHKLSRFPGDFKPHPKLLRQLETRAKMIESQMDWGTAEALAFGSLVVEGYPVRLSGQDAERGTFSHRHSVLYDYETGKSYVPLNHLDPKQSEYTVYNSHLSETGVLGFEYGHAIADPKTLTIWEAQFGDFANGAQVIIDQFISSSESKWQRMCGLVLLLPHGYEGQGPEHSSARFERFLQLCGRDNMQVCNLTTPAQIFHALRRQVKREFRKPLVIMSPKSLLRHPMAVSTLADLSERGFQEIIESVHPIKNPRRVIFCTGKVYYDLMTEIEAKKISDVAVIRIEQLYPWPLQKIEKVLAQYASCKDFCWVQEEPRNMGAWSFVRDLFPAQNELHLRYIGRATAAAPAVGSAKVHAAEQKGIIEEALK